MNWLKLGVCSLIVCAMTWLVVEQESVNADEPQPCPDLELKANLKQNCNFPHQSETCPDLGGPGCEGSTRVWVFADYFDPFNTQARKDWKVVPDKMVDCLVWYRCKTDLMGKCAPDWKNIVDKKQQLRFQTVACQGG